MSRVHENVRIYFVASSIFVSRNEEGEACDISSYSLALWSGKCEIFVCDAKT
jgi:hypothetical protein